jgi:hypothetical protein
MRRKEKIRIEENIGWAEDEDSCERGEIEGNNDVRFK